LKRNRKRQTAHAGADRFERKTGGGKTRKCKAPPLNTTHKLVVITYSGQELDHGAHRHGATKGARTEPDIGVLTKKAQHLVAVVIGGRKDLLRLRRTNDVTVPAGAGSVQGVALKCEATKKSDTVQRTVVIPASKLLYLLLRKSWRGVGRGRG
jgi:hypothetical protein